MAITDINRNLGPSSSQSHTSEAIGHAEDYSKIIINIDPDRTFYLSEMGEDADAVTLKFGWMTEGLRPPQVNAHLEKEDYTSQSVGSLEAAENHCQRFVTSGYVTEAQSKVKKIYTPEDEFSRQRYNAFLQHASDIEYAIVNNGISRAESGTTPAMTGGVPYFMQVQTLAVSIASGVVVSTEPHNLTTGDFVYFNASKMPAGLSANTIYYVRLDAQAPTTKFTIYNTMKDAVEGLDAGKVVPTDAGTEVVLVKNNVVDMGGVKDFDLDDINNVMQMCYNRGGNPSLAVMSPAKKRRFSSIVTAETQINRSMSKSRKLDLVADVLETDFGVVTAKAHRMYPDTRIDFMDMGYWDLKWFARTHEVTGIAKKGSYDEFFIESWMGIKGSQPKASGSLLNVKR